jgi:hypothetical protein
MPTIVISRDAATFAPRVADGVARKLGRTVEYRDIVARRGTATMVPANGAARDGDVFDHFLLYGDAQSTAAAREVCNLALPSEAVICGAGVAQLLSDIGQVVRVRVRTTMALRVKRMMACMESDDPQPALQRVLTSDAYSTHGHAALFGVADREDPRFFDLVVDSGRESIDQCVDTIVALAAAPRFQATPDSRAELKTRALRLSAKVAQRGTQSVLPERNQNQPTRSWFDAWTAFEPTLTATHSARIAWVT